MWSPMCGGVHRFNGPGGPDLRFSPNRRIVWCCPRYVLLGATRTRVQKLPPKKVNFSPVGLLHLRVVCVHVLCCARCSGVVATRANPAVRSAAWYVAVVAEPRPRRVTAAPQTDPGPGPGMQLTVDLLNPSAESEARKHKLKRLVQSPNSFFMDVKCPGCFNITTVFSHAQTTVLCGSCSMMLCQPTGGKARLTEGCSFRKKLD